MARPRITNYRRQLGQQTIAHHQLHSVVSLRSIVDDGVISWDGDTNTDRNRCSCCLNLSCLDVKCYWECLSFLGCYSAFTLMDTLEENARMDTSIFEYTRLLTRRRTRRRLLSKLIYCGFYFWLVVKIK